MNFTYTTPNPKLVQMVVRVEGHVPDSIMRVAKQWSFFEHDFYGELFLDLDALLNEFGNITDFSSFSEAEEMLYKYIKAAYDDGVWILVFSPQEF